MTSERSLGRPAILVGGAIVLLLAGLGFGLLLPRLLTPAPPARSGAPAVAPVATLPGEADLERELTANPPDIKRLLAIAHLALDEGRGSPAIRAYRRVLEAEPKNVEALTHVGVLLFQGGLVDQALSHLDRALAIDPTYAHALWDKAQILYEAKRDYAGAIKAWEAFLAVMPSGKDADRVRALIAEAKGRAPASTPAAPGRKAP